MNRRWKTVEFGQTDRLWSISCSQFSDSALHSHFSVQSTWDKWLLEQTACVRIADNRLRFYECVFPYDFTANRFDLIVLSFPWAYCLWKRLISRYSDEHHSFQRAILLFQFAFTCQQLDSPCFLRSIELLYFAKDGSSTAAGDQSLTEIFMFAGTHKQWTITNLNRSAQLES